MADRELSDKIARLLMADRQVSQFGLHPFDPSRDTPQDVGLGGPSTEYTATSLDPNGVAFNYPQLWWDNYGNPFLLPEDQALNQSLMYEQTSGQQFPRYNTLENADFASQNRSLLGGAEQTPLASIFGFRNY